MISSATLRQLSAATILVPLIVGFGQAQSRKLTGQVFAYNPAAHLFKVASSVQNQEIVIFKLKYRQSFAKLVFASVGQEQFDPKHLNGSTTIAIRGIREPACDEDRPRFFGAGESLVPPDAPKTRATDEVKLEQKYKLTDFFSNEAIPQIAHLDCYRVETPRK